MFELPQCVCHWVRTAYFLFICCWTLLELKKYFDSIFSYLDRLCHDKTYRLLELQGIIQLSGELVLAWQSFLDRQNHLMHLPCNTAVFFSLCQTNVIFECTFITSFLPILWLHRKVYGYRLIILQFDFFFCYLCLSYWQLSANWKPNFKMCAAGLKFLFVVCYSMVIYWLKKGLLISCIDYDINGERIVLSVLYSYTYACNRFLLLLLEKVIYLVWSIVPVRKMVTL